MDDHAEGIEEIDDIWYMVPFCDVDIGMALYFYSDSECTTPMSSMSPDSGCPKDACCHLSGLGLLTDINFDGTVDFMLGVPYSIEVVDQSGSQYGLSFGGAFAQLFKSFG